MNKIEPTDVQYVQDRGHNPKGWVPCPVGENGKINPHVTQMILEDNTYVTVFHIKPVYYETLSGDWRPLSEIASHIGNRKLIIEGWDKVHPRYINWLKKRMELIDGELLLPTMIPTSIEVIESLQYARVGHMGLTITTVYPDPDPETTTVDGYTWDSWPPGRTWAAFRGLSTSTNTNPSVASGQFLYLAEDNSAGKYRNIAHSFFLYDTSAIGSDPITSAVMSLKGLTPSLNDSPNVTLDHVMVATSPASNTNIATTDHGNVSYTAFSDVLTYAGWSTSAYNDYTLNTAGEAAINGSGVSKFGVINETHDRANSAWTWAGQLFNYLTCYFAETADVTSDPKLVVTHGSAVETTVPDRRVRHRWW